eukprot:TRINITY_DN618_c0_g1_i2.p1 TRINITY_DN618_c0_g1~~TRINITY_DN618_c0_g1_i2.p1  ORF type:complete len:195 (-),score=50.91 TRINITY_DN618_c0_g1_i2:128-712(-)
MCIRDRSTGIWKRVMALTPSTIPPTFHRKTCGMHPLLRERVRHAVAFKEASSLCQSLLPALEALCGHPSVAVIIAPPIGKPTGVATSAPEPQVVLWLLLDPLDVDCKQTSFCADPTLMDRLYKWNGAPAVNPLVAECGECLFEYLSMRGGEGSYTPGYTADAILVLGSNDIRVAHRAAELWKQGAAPILSLIHI